MAESFLRTFCADNGLRMKPIDPDVLNALAQRAWAGNVRELKNVVERMAILSGDRITKSDLPEEGRLGRSIAPSSSGPSQDAPVALSEGGSRMSLREYRDHAESEYILATLDEVGWNISRAALLLGVERTNLHKKMRGYGIKREGIRTDED